VAGTIYREQNLLNVEDAVVPVKEIFRLQNDQELEEAETLYLRSGEDKDRTAVILAATRGDKLGPLTEELPKAMLKVGRRSILERAVSHLGEYGIKDITAVAGYKKQKIQAPGVKVVENPDWDSSGQMASLAAAEESLRGESLVLFGDILFKKYILQLALADPADFVLVVDTQVDADRDYLSDFITADGDPSQDMFDHPVTAREMQFASPAGDWYGEWIGLLKLSPKGSAKVREFIRENRHMPEFSSLNLRDMINRFIQQGETVSVQSIAGHWVDVNNLEDITLANEF
ncbi:MAG: phosphocholine cytidylyltransferase family protein, partial [Deltaproteobacteria bacterium]|nr:phosphocholine cytidylyltransferase family protein [Deltaproteobacteria bacterium]